MSLNKKNVAAISAAVVGFGMVASHTNAGTYDNIPFDGTTAPWNTIPVAATAAGGQASPDLVQLKIANNSSYIYFQLTYDTPTDPTSNGGTYIGIDSDNNPNTGYNVYGSSLIGTNAAYENDYPFSQAKDTSGNEVFNSGGSFSDSGLSSAPAYFSGTSTQTQEIAIPIDDYETDTSSGGYTGPVFQTSTNSFTVEFYTGSSVLGPVLYTIAGPPVQSTYALTGSGDFNQASSWSNGVPTGVGAEADFLGAITANHTVYSDVSITLSKIVFNNSFTYVLAGAGDLTMSASGTSAVVDAQAGTQKITLPITIATSTIFSAESGATLVIGAPVTVDSGATLTQSGTGTVQYISTITVNSGGAISLAATSHAASLALVGASTAAIISETGTTKTALQVDSLSLSSSSTLDLKNADLVVHGGTFSTIQSSIATGFASGNWTGLGIDSSAASADTSHLTAIGVMPDGTSGAATYSTFDGIAVHPGDVLVKYTYYGDANLDGKVDGSDYSRIDSGYATGASGWFNGDFNYDGVINGSDYTLIDNAFNTQGSQIGASPSAESTAEIAGIAGSSAVPEPASLGILIIGSIGLLGRRRLSV